VQRGTDPKALRIAVPAVLSAILFLPSIAYPEGDPHDGTLFEPHPMSEPLYAVQPPDADPDRQQHVLKAADGVDLYVETWLPAAKGGHVPPEEIPTVVLMTPYAGYELEGLMDNGYPVEYFVSRGYAFAEHHIRGTGRSGGCLDQTGAKQIDDGARVIEYLGRDAPWSDGNVGSYGISYDGEAQTSVAGLGDPEKTKYLKAIVPVSAIGGQYEYSYFDGVPYLGWGLLQNYAFYLGVTALPTTSISPMQYLQKVGCQPEFLAASLDQSGDWTPFWHSREYRTGAPTVRAATLLVHGLADFSVLPIATAGFFDRLPETTPHKGVFGIWEHAFPDDHAVRAEWNRQDWLDMVLAWYDRYLKGLPTGVEEWPNVQVQGTDGLWRAEADWPSTGGPGGRLALGPNGKLGVTSPSGETTYSEGTGLALQDPTASRAVYETGPLAERLEVTGQPVLDLWVVLDKPDAHLVAEIETFDAAGDPIAGGINWSMRSARHLDPIVDGRFVQEEGRPAPVGVPIHIEMRFLPADLVIPKGGSVRLTLSGLLTVERFFDPTLGFGPNPLAGSGLTGSTPSGAMTTVTIVHDCAHPSILRFLMPQPMPDYLRVKDARGISPAPAEPLISDGGGIADAPVCAPTASS